MTNASDTISASDVEKYGYCPLSWWLSLKSDVKSQELKKGIEKHKAIAGDIHRIQMDERVSKETETIVMWFAISATVISLVGVSFLFPQGTESETYMSNILAFISLIWLLASTFFLYRAERVATPSARMVYERIILIFAIVAVLIAVNSITFLKLDRQLGGILQLLALLWLIAASFFLYISLKSLQRASRFRKKHGVRKGQISYADKLDGSGDPLVSKTHNISGAPDYILTTESSLVPVEIKTGRTPKGPLFSHILQIAVYCLLIEDKYKHAPTHGIIKYSEAEHEIEYNEDMRKLVLSKLEEMRSIIRTGDAHRNLL